MTQRTTSATARAQTFHERTVAEIMERQVQTAHAKTAGDVVASLMIEGFGSVPVVDDRQRLIEHDLLRLLDRGQPWMETPAEAIMSVNPYSVRPETKIGTLIHVMQASDLVRAPVVDESGTLVGIVARRDVLRAYLSAGQ
jgi:CBS-domain-containing membrane protein